MAPPPSFLEYEEEDLFGSDDDSTAQSALLASLRTAKPIPSISLASSSLASSTARTRAQVPESDAEKRLAELRSRKSKPAEQNEGTGQGVNRLRSYCLTVIRANSSRIWDIGDMEYPLIHTFLDDLPMNQLSGIESTSPHIRKDTDWLWEIFLLHDYPLFHERCQERKGERRSSGWRRMYMKAKDDATERQSHAADRVAERYRQLDEEKAAKRIVFVDKVMTKGKRRGGGGFRGSVAPARGGQLPGQSGREDRISKLARSTAAIALAKARADAQRARVALTHASGKFVAPPPSRSKPRTEENQLFKNPYLPSASQNQTAATRVSSSSSGPSRSSVIGRHTVTSPPSSPLPGSYPSRDSAQNRAALPPHLERPSLPLVAPSSPARFRLSDGRPKSKEIHRPAVQNFEPPKPAVPAGMDFFGDRSRAAPKGLLESLHRSHDESRTGEKRKSHEEEMPKKKQQSMDNARPVSVTQPVPAVPLVRQPLTTGGSMSADEHARLSSLLFRKRAKPRPGAGRVGA